MELLTLLLFTFLLSLTIQLILFIPAYIFQTDKLTDISYSLSFILLAGILLVLNYSFTNLIVFLLITLWGLRLGMYLLRRIFYMKKDVRFDGIRERFFKFLTFWVVQGIAVWIILLPAIFFLSVASFIPWFSILGIAIFLFGLSFEAIADYQKFQHKKTSKLWIESGLWKYSRHPNYFGEIVLWFGLYFFTLPSLSFIQSIIALSSPIFILVLLIYFTGIPQLEKSGLKKWGDNKKYLEYVTKTPVLIPKMLK